MVCRSRFSQWKHDGEIAKRGLPNLNMKIAVVSCCLGLKGQYELFGFSSGTKILFGKIVDLI